MLIGSQALGDFILGSVQSQIAPTLARSNDEALFFSMNSRNFEYFNGKGLNQNNIEQIVSLSLSTKKKTIPGKPLFGFDYDGAMEAGYVNSVGFIKNEVLRCLSFLINKSLIKIISIEVERSNPNAIFFTVNYTRLGTSEKKKASGIVA